MIKNNLLKKVILIVALLTLPKTKPLTQNQARACAIGTAILAGLGKEFICNHYEREAWSKRSLIGTALVSAVTGLGAYLLFTSYTDQSQLEEKIYEFNKTMQEIELQIPQLNNIDTPLTLEDYEHAKELILQAQNLNNELNEQLKWVVTLYNNKTTDYEQLVDLIEQFKKLTVSAKELLDKCLTCKEQVDQIKFKHELTMHKDKIVKIQKEIPQSHDIADYAFKTYQKPWSFILIDLDTNALVKRVQSFNDELVTSINEIIQFDPTRAINKQALAYLAEEYTKLQVQVNELLDKCLVYRKQIDQQIVQHKQYNMQMEWLAEHLAYQSRMKSLESEIAILKKHNLDLQNQLLQPRIRFVYL